MFLVSFVFAVGLIFVIQQSLFQYTDIDISEPSNINEFRIMESTLEVINRTIINTDSCDSGKESFTKKMEELKTFFGRETIRKLYQLEVLYQLDCTFWENSRPAESPLNLTIRLNGPKIKSYGSFALYHII